MEHTVKNSLWIAASITIHILTATPPRTIPPHLKSGFTLGNSVPVRHRYFNNAYPSTEPRVYTRQQIDAYLQMIAQGKTNYYGKTDTYLYEALELFNIHVQEKDVGIIGSVKPWYEAVTIHYGGNPITVEYNKLVSEHPKIRIMTVDEYDKNPVQFDAILSISSIEHDGLGRYGDPINPNGDLEAMEKTKAMLKDGGLLFLAVPVGRDCLVWNAHRIYGEKRLPLLLKGWKVVAFFGEGNGPEAAYRYALGMQMYQPVFVLQKQVAYAVGES